ncbi:MAG: sugar ABC transporter permease [Thermobacillus sp.]|uniref:carbohydrate ABC transporter permease n=1 Tax=Thermobacillus sp. TaxID=2108467 RepID=UPI000E363006|nr:carbohydrate ABC transporter permease [Thermobacillus sp.]REK58405.1 MAG: sugar ABC transporter permease [Thermobacillus sp.]
MLRRYAGPFFFYVTATAIAVIVMIPFFWMISTSLKSKGALTALPIEWIPKKISFEGYRKVFDVFPFARTILNSAFVSVMTTVVRLAAAAMAAYAFAKMRFRGREVLFAAVLATMMIPQQVTFIPLFLVMKELQLINTFTGLIAPSIFNAFAIFMLRQHMRTVNDAYLDAAVMDGASHRTIFVRLMIPLSAPILATLAVIAFMDAWNDYLWPLVMLTDPNKMTLPLALSKLSGQYATDYNTLMAGSLISIVPIVAVFLAAQQHFKAGLQVGGVKG